MRYRSLRRFFGWLAAEGDIEQNRVDGVDAPKLDEALTPVLSDVEVQRLLKTCGGGRDFGERRDYALLRVLLEGPRRGEVVSMPTDPEHLNLREGWASVSGKSGDRVLSLGKKAAYAVDRYLRVRSQHRFASNERLWSNLDAAKTGFVRRNCCQPSALLRAQGNGPPGWFLLGGISSSSPPLQHIPHLSESKIGPDAPLSSAPACGNRTKRAT